MKVKVMRAPNGRELLRHLDGGPSGIIKFDLDISPEQASRLPINLENLDTVFWARVQSFSWNDDAHTKFQVKGLLLPTDQKCIRCKIGFTYRHEASPYLREMEIHYNS